MNDSKRAQGAKRNPSDDGTNPRRVKRPSQPRIPIVPVALQPAPVIMVYTTAKRAVEAAFKRL
jgi:hypothetical protein